ncbi:hypothetical protein LRS13_20410 [Svornostia abyssi]|uniref:DUF7380 domain-containing protein n=1 Tax=Svornostia abyssi TaxID=2898438 RepID=A0ABY5PEC8_9ACTN|nr:hypothetical protein LRS13_20410 [Parviterribacteraceae bacterium J379]
MLVTEHREEIHARTGPFAPRIEWEHSAFPQPLADVPIEILDEWVDLFESLPEPAAQARLGDLLWVRRHGDRPDIAARAAAEAYLTLATTPQWQTMDQVDSITRAIELAKQLSDDELLGDAIDVCAGFARTELADPPERRPGVPLRLLEQLTSVPAGRRPDDLTVLLASALHQFGDDPFLAESVLEMQAQIAPPDDKAAIRRRQIERWREAAQHGDGLLRRAHLQRGQELAASVGEPELASQLAEEAQSIPPEEMEMKVASREIEISYEAADAFIDAVADRHDLPTGLIAFGLQGPPAANLDELNATVADLAQRFPMSRLVTRQLLGEFNALVFEATTSEQHDRVDLAQQRAWAIMLFEPIAVRVLDGLEAKLHRPLRDELATLFGRNLIDDETANALADGAARYWAGDMPGAAHLLAPNFEAAVRKSAARLGIPVIKLPRGETPGGVLTLGALLSSLEGRLDEAWRRHLVNLLVDPLGVNLRNRIAHGLAGGASRGEVALLIHAALFVSSWDITEPVPSQTAEPPA